MRTLRFASAFVVVAILTAASAALAQKSAARKEVDLRPAPIKPSTNTLQDNMPRVERGKLVDPLAPKPVKPEPSVIDKAADAYKNAPVRPSYDPKTKSPIIEYQKKF